MPAFILESPDALKDFVGRELGTSEWLPITQERIAQFAETTEDRQWIHVDAERARRESPFGTTVAHGFLTLSLLSHFMAQAIQIRGVRLAVNYGLNRVRFPAPVRSGAKLRGRFTLQSIQDVSNAIEATYVVSIECEGAPKPCCVAEWLIRYYR